MEQYIVSARKYRPATFNSVIGQESITLTLKNTIRTQHLAQAYLFCGPRGVGKTTCARIFAKTINCLNLTPEIEPCNTCESCKAFNDSRSFNIHELDAASNNSVEDIRNLIDQVRIPPQIGRYSVYIIDEVHMLSQAAFNAFLKTLEEPPRHAVFILATTEKHKIIPTILSRCQIFDFNRIRVNDTVKYLGTIAANEGIQAEADGLNIIAQKADGAMRDALSIFDQIVSFTGGHITYQNVISSLNILDYDYFFRLVDGFVAGDIPKSLLLFNDILDHGFDPHHFLTGLAGHFRDLLVCRDQATVSLLEVGEGIRERYLAQAKICPPDFLLEALKICNQTDAQFRTSRNQRLLIELALLQLCMVNQEKKKEPRLTEPAPTATATVTATAPVPATATATAPATATATVPSPTPAPKASRPAVSTTPYPTTMRTRDALKGNNAGLPNTPEPETQGPIPETVMEPDDLALSFTPAELEEKFNSFVLSIQSDHPRMYSSLVGCVPEIKDDFRIELIMENATQLDEFNRELRSELQAWLRKELKNFSLQVLAAVKEVSGQRTAFTSEDKYRHMVEVNPLVEKLRQQLNLEFE
ncbi:MAG: DNA polymerase III subunit gamma/tau [Bacteroidales bacterium]